MFFLVAAYIIVSRFWHFGEWAAEKLHEFMPLFALLRRMCARIQAVHPADIFGHK